MKSYMSEHRYKFDLRDAVNRLRAKNAEPGRAINIKMRVANDPASPQIPGYAELDTEGNFTVTFTNLSGQTKSLCLTYHTLLWEIHCREAGFVPQTQP